MIDAVCELLSDPYRRNTTEIKVRALKMLKHLTDKGNTTVIACLCELLKNGKAMISRDVKEEAMSALQEIANKES